MPRVIDMEKLKAGEWALIQNDCLYSTLYQRHANDPQVMSILTKAGYVYEPRTVMDDLILKNTRILSMPIKARRAMDTPAAVLVSTGSYSPIHAGHVGIMEVAKRYVERLGYSVVQGVISPSHDAYVSTKYGGQAKMHVGIRAQRIFEAVEDSDWLVQDRMEGEMLSCAVNFSTVLEHVRDYLMVHHPEVSDNTPIFYVYGSDNAGFSDAFIGNEPYHGICVARADASLEMVKNAYAMNSNLHFIHHTEDFGHHSSTQVRAELAKASSNNHEEDKGLYLIRADGVPDAFAEALNDLIAQNIEPGIEIKIISSADFSLETTGTVSLDKYVGGQYNLDVSRTFEISAGQLKAKHLTSMSSPLIRQVLTIAPGDYTLVDDDSITGLTMDEVEQAMKAVGARVTARRTLIAQVLGGRPLYDIIDARDFLVSAPKGGLVVTHIDQAMRAPYLFPFINVVSRARILPARQHIFSRQVYALNLAFVSGQTLADVEPSKAAFLKACGPHEDVGSFCRYYMAVLDNLIQSYAVEAGGV